MAWLTGWTYRKSMTLSRASGAVTAYQMQLLVGEDIGAVGENVDCNGHIQTDFDDLRFTAADGTTLLPYWIQSITGTTPNQLATVWIKFDSIAIDATTFYMYYGKSDATAYSNGDSTFLIFDHFLSDSLDTNKWTLIQGDIGIASSELVLTGTVGTRGQIIQKSANYPFNPIGSAIHTLVRNSDNTPGGAHWCTMFSADYVYWLSIYGTTTANRVSTDTRNVTTTQNYSDITATDASHIYKALWTSGLVEFFQDTTNFKDHTTTIPTVDMGVLFSEGATASNVTYIDWVFVRKYVATEPTWGSWSGEETTLPENGWDFVGTHWTLDASIFFNGVKAAKCITVAEDEVYSLRALDKSVSWNSIKMQGRFRTSIIPAATCGAGHYYPLASTGKSIDALRFGGPEGPPGHFRHYDAVGGIQTFPNDTTYVVDTWYKWEVILDFTNSVQKTRVNGVDLGDITLKDIDGTTLNDTHTITKLVFVGSSNAGTSQFNIDDIEVYSYPAGAILFYSGFETGFVGTQIVEFTMDGGALSGGSITVQRGVDKSAIGGGLIGGIGNYQRGVSILMAGGGLSGGVVDYTREISSPMIGGALLGGGSIISSILVQMLSVFAEGGVLAGGESEITSLLVQVLSVIANGGGVVGDSALIRKLAGFLASGGALIGGDSISVVPIENFGYQRLGLQPVFPLTEEGSFSFRREKVEHSEPSNEGSFSYEKLKLIKN